MRVQNEGTGKSSWWMINPEAKPGKAARRRATSMETKAYEKRKGRVKKKVDALRQAALGGSIGNSLGGSMGSSIGGQLGQLGQLVDQTPSPCSSLSEGLDMYPDSPMIHAGIHPLARPGQSGLAYLHSRSPNRPPNYPPLPGQSSSTAGAGNATVNGQHNTQPSIAQQITGDFRPRASSNASSCSRLSPPLNSALDDPLSPLGSNAAWSQSTAAGNDLQSLYTTQNSNQQTTSTAGELDSFNEHQLVENMTATMTLNGSNVGQQSNPQVPVTQSPMQQQMQQVRHALTMNSLSPQTVMYMNGSANNNQMINGYIYSTSVDTKRGIVQPQPQHTHQHGNCACIGLGCNDDENNNRSDYAVSMEQLNGLTGNVCNGLHGLNNGSGQLVELLKSSSPLMSLAQTPCMDYAIKRERASTYAGSTMDCGGGYRTAPGVGQLLQMNTPLPNDLDLNLDSLQGGLECDVDQVIKHELSVDGELDFNFEPLHSSPTTSSPSASIANAASTHSWVH